MGDRFVVVGMGSIGRRHARVIRAVLPDAEIAALRHASTGGLPDGLVDREYTSIDDALAFAPRAVIVANPAPMHVDVCLPFGAAGVPLLVEKPLAHDASTAARLVEASSSWSAPVVVGYNLRHTAQLRALLDAVARGEAGAVVSVRAEVGQHLASWRADADYRHGVSARRDLGGGTLLELSHDIDYVLAMLGAPSRVGALTTTSPALETDVEDVAHLLLAFDRGDQPPCVASISLDHVRHDTKRGCEVIGTEATLRWDALGARVERFDPSTRAWTELPIPATTAPDSYHAQFEHFMAVVRGETAPLSSPPDALRVLGVVDAARTSAREGRFVMMTTEAA